MYRLLMFVCVTSCLKTYGQLRQDDIHDIIAVPNRRDPRSDPRQH